MSSAQEVPVSDARLNEMLQAVDAEAVQLLKQELRQRQQSPVAARPHSVRSNVRERRKSSTSTATGTTSVVGSQLDTTSSAARRVRMSETNVKRRRNSSMPRSGSAPRPIPAPRREMKETHISVADIPAIVSLAVHLERKRHGDLRQQLASLQSEATRALEAGEAASRERDTLQRELHQAQERMGRLQEENSLLEAQVAEGSQALLEAQQGLRKLQEDAKTLSALTQRAEEEATGARSAASALQEQHQQQVGALKAALGSARDTIQALSASARGVVHTIQAAGEQASQESPSSTALPSQREVAELLSALSTQATATIPSSAPQITVATAPSTQSAVPHIAGHTGAFNTATAPSTSVLSNSPPPSSAPAPSLSAPSTAAVPALQSTQSPYTGSPPGPSHHVQVPVPAPPPPSNPSSPPAGMRSAPLLPGATMQLTAVPSFALSPAPPGGIPCAASSPEQPSHAAPQALSSTSSPLTSPPSAGLPPPSAPSWPAAAPTPQAIPAVRRAAPATAEAAPRRPPPRAPRRAPLVPVPLTASNGSAHFAAAASRLSTGAPLHTPARPRHARSSHTSTSAGGGDGVQETLTKMRALRAQVAQSSASKPGAASSLLWRADAGQVPNF